MRDLLNLSLLLAVAAPPVLSVALLNACQDDQGVCGLYQRRPVAALNALFALHCDLTFWLISLAQARSWDPRRQGWTGGCLTARVRAHTCCSAGFALRAQRKPRAGWAHRSAPLDVPPHPTLLP